MNLFNRGNNFLTKKMYEKGTEPVEYITGNVRKPVRAILGATTYESATNDGSIFKVEVRDFVIRAALLVGEPKRGDIIHAVGCRYEVMPMAGTDCFKYADAFKKKYRIHTKKI
jgi:hypothetical protein